MSLASVFSSLLFSKNLSSQNSKASNLFSKNLSSQNSKASNLKPIISLAATVADTYRRRRGVSSYLL
jgi:hypothetical protein